MFEYFIPTNKGDGHDGSISFNFKSAESENRRITAVASREMIDRSGEVVALSAIKKAVKEFMKNPVVLACHSHRLDDGHSPVVGKVVDYEFKGKDFIITVEFAPTDLGREYLQLYQGKYQRAFSISFRINKREIREVDGQRDIPVFTEIELIEISCCPVPCNPAALSKNFFSRKRIEREADRIEADADRYIDLLERAEKEGQQFTEAEQLVLDRLEKAGEELSEFLWDVEIDGETLDLEDVRADARDFQNGIIDEEEFDLLLAEHKRFYGEESVLEALRTLDGEGGTAGRKFDFGGSGGLLGGGFDLEADPELSELCRRLEKSVSGGDPSADSGLEELLNQI